MYMALRAPDTYQGLILFGACIRDYKEHKKNLKKVGKCLSHIIPRVKAAEIEKNLFLSNP